MKCSCPKCSAIIDVDPLLVPDNGTYSKCSACKKRFWVSREFFAGRAMRKKGEIFCAECGEELDHTIACPSCRALFPEFYAVQAKKPVTRRLPEIKLSFAPSELRSSKPTYKRSRAVSPKPVRKTPKALMAAVSVAALVALVICGGYFYHQRTLENEYSRNFVRALYAIKTGRDVSHETAAKIVSRLNATGQQYAVLISDQDEARLNKIKSNADKLMTRINDPPKKYLEVNEKLVRLYNTYSEMNSVMISPPNSLESFKISSSKLENDFDAGVRDMKANLPKKLSESIKTAQVRYKNLRDI